MTFQVVNTSDAGTHYCMWCGSLCKFSETLKTFDKDYCENTKRISSL